MVSPCTRIEVQVPGQRADTVVPTKASEATGQRSAFSWLKSTCSAPASNSPMQVCGHALAATSAAASPWFIVPADDKDNAQLMVSQIVLDALEAMQLNYPEEVLTKTKTNSTVIRKSVHRRS